MDDTSAEEDQNEQGLGEDEWLEWRFLCGVCGGYSGSLGSWEGNEGRSVQHLTSRDKLNKVQYQLK